MQTAVGGTQTAKVWDARTGQELKGEPIPPETARAQSARTVVRSLTRSATASS